MKIGLILPGNVWFCPYVHIYTQILDEQKADYDIISWNRDGSENQRLQFDKQYKSNGRLSKIYPYLRYASYIRKTIREKHYDKLIVFGPQLAIFINRFLAKYYKGRYIFDYRDLSIEQKSYFKHPFQRVLRNSYVNVISSPGFKKCLPSGFEYLLSHNFNVNAVREALAGGGDESEVRSSTTTPINVLTIGGIRDYSSNIEVVKALANKKGFSLQFVGKGEASEMIEEYVSHHSIENVKFEGYYPKEKEAGYIRQSSFLNIFYPRIITHDTALSNRFYNALIYRKPMIVTADTTQGDYVKKHHLGLSLTDCDNLDIQLSEYLSTMDYDAFSHRCNELLREFLRDYDILKSRVIDFLSIP